MGEGMPMYRGPFQKGRLIIQFKVTFPSSHWTTPENVKNLEWLLPPKKEVIVTDDMEEVGLDDYDPHHRSGDQDETHMMKTMKIILEKECNVKHIKNIL